MKRPLVILFVIIITAVTMTAETRTYHGDVLTENGRNFVYKGSIDSGNKLAVKRNECYDDSGEVIIKEKTEYLENSCEIKNMHIQDFNTGKEEIVIDKGTYYLVKYKKNHSSCFKTKKIKKEGRIIHPTVIAMYLQKNMQQILHSEGVDVTLLLPNRLTTIRFTLTHNGTKTINAEECYKISLEPNNMLLKQLVNPIYFYIDKDDPSILVKYEGVIAPTDSRGNSQNGQILFSFN